MLNTTRNEFTGESPDRTGADPRPAVRVQDAGLLEQLRLVGRAPIERIAARAGRIRPSSPCTRMTGGAGESRRIPSTSRRIMPLAARTWLV